MFDYEDGRTAKYDFATKQAIGIKGKPVGKLCGQLRGFSIKNLLECCDDQRYAKFLAFVQEKEPFHIENIGTILDRVTMYSNFEQIFSAGFDEIICSGRNDDLFKYTIKDIPKSLVKICKTRNVKISNKFLQYYKQNQDAHFLAYNLDYISLCDNDIWEILSTDSSDYDRETGHTYWSYFNRLLDDYGYNAKPLLLYIDQLKTFEAIDNTSYIVRELYDYAKMMDTISNKFDKYPRHFLTTHKIACRNYNRLKQEFSEEIFKKRITKEYECSFGDYQFIYPECTQDIKDEAVQQNNCVASYIDQVIDGKCHIMFLRKKSKIKNSLVTIEIRNNYIVQAKRRFNDEITTEERKVIDSWNKKFEDIKEKEGVAA